MDMTHLHALELNLSNTRQRMAQSPGLAVYVAQLEREIAGEREFLGLPPVVATELTDDELLAQLGA